MDSKTSNIEHLVRRRAGHVMVAYQKKLYMWGGYMEEPHEGTYNLQTQSLSHFHSQTDIWIYDSLLNIWHRKVCSGETPCGLSGASAGVIDNFMYLFGGFNGDNPFEGGTNRLWRLNLDTFVWTRCHPKGFQPFPCDKSSSWVYRDRFYIFGGYGPALSWMAPPVPVSFDTEDDSSRKGWLDQFLYYDATHDKWVWPPTKGAKPCSRAAHASAALKGRAYVFGGRHKEERLGDFYSVDLETHHWNLVPQVDCNPAPLGRSWHTLNAVADDKLLLYGGFSTANQVLNDAWLFEAGATAWRILSESRYPKRLWHCGASVRSDEVTFLGGISNNLLSNTLTKEHAEDMLRIRFSPPTLFELALEYASDVRNIPKAAWSQLPPLVRKILQVRTDPFEVHGV